jgi:hypothetical protein
LGLCPQPARIKYDGDGHRVHIFRRFVGQQWSKLNLIQENNASTAEEAAEAELHGKFTTPALSAGQVLQYGLLREESIDPNATDFSLGRFEPLVTIVAVLAGESQSGWIIDQNIAAGGTFYRRQVSTGARVTSMILEVGENPPTRDDTGIWRISNPAQTLASTARTDHVVEVLNLLPGHHLFATVLLIDGSGQWSSLAEEFTMLLRKVTVNFKELEILNDGDSGGTVGTTSEVTFNFLVQQGEQNVQNFPYFNENVSVKQAEKYITLEHFNFVHVLGPEVGTLENSKIGLWVKGEDHDGLASNDKAEGTIALALPSRLRKNAVQHTRYRANALAAST